MPDWSSAAEPVPYAKLDNPQTLNLYIYATDNPTTLTDPTGHMPASQPPLSEGPDATRAMASFGWSIENDLLEFITPKEEDKKVTQKAVSSAKKAQRKKPGKHSGLLPELSSSFFSRAHGKGERRRVGKPSGTPNKEKVNRKARYDPTRKKWWVPDQNGKQKWLGPGFQPTPEQLKKAGLAMTGVAGAGAATWTIWQILEAAAATSAAF